MQRVILFTIFTFLTLLLSCSTPENILTNPENTEILSQKSFNLEDTILANQTYLCSLYLFLPEFADSVAVLLVQEDFDTVLVNMPVDVNDYIIPFPVTITRSGQFSLIAYLYRNVNGVDTLLKTFNTKGFTPSVSLDSTRYKVHIGDSISLKFTIHDSDKDIRRATIWIDSINSNAFLPVLGNVKDSVAGFSYGIRKKVFDTTRVFVIVEDLAGNSSEPLVCTLDVYDTTPPVLTLIGLKQSFGDTVKALPCSLYVKVTDDSPIDSITFNSIPMQIKQDTAFLSIAELDSGKTNYTIYARNRCGIKDSFSLPILYTGKRTYPPVITSGLKGQTISENQLFKKISLDSFVEVASEANYTKENLKWSVVEESVGSKLTFTLDSISRVVTIAVPDSEWNGTEAATFFVNAPGNLSVPKVLSFTVTPNNDSPVLLKKSYCKVYAATFDTIFVDTCASDPDNSASSLSWTTDTTSGEYYYLRDITKIFIKPPILLKSTALPVKTLGFSRKWVITPLSSVVTASKTPIADSVKVTVSDGAISKTVWYVIKNNLSCAPIVIKPIDPLF